MKDERLKMKDELEEFLSFFILHPSAFRLLPSAESPLWRTTMAHLRHKSPRNPEISAYYDPQHPLRETLTQQPYPQPLGVLLVCRRNETWHRADAEERRPFDLEDPHILRRWEDRIEQRIYRIYGYGDGEKDAWEFFTLLEFDDMEVWNRLQQGLENAGFSAYFDWEIIAFGRRLG